MKNSDEICSEIESQVAAFQVEAEKRGLYHRGYRFWPPFACGRCGEPISAYQFAFSRSCGGCDLGTSYTARLSSFDPRWFVLGKAELENAQDSALIHPQFIPAHTRRDLAPLLPRVHPLPHPPRKPRPRVPLPRTIGPRMR